MTRLAQTERTLLCDTALQVGQDQPTLCGDWTVKDLVVHLLLREGSPAAAGIMVPALSRFTDSASRRIGRRDFTVLVEKLRGGPPLLSPFRVPKVDELVNTMEYYIHLEDIRRAQPGWTPRDLGTDVETTLWSGLVTPGKALTRKAPDGVTVENTVTGQTRVLNKDIPSVTVSGRPGEVALYLFGRSDQAQVELTGDPDAVARLKDTSLGM